MHTKIFLATITATLLLGGCGTTEDKSVTLSIPAAKSIQEGQTNLFPISADKEEATFAITGPDKTLFTITNGTLIFAQTPDFEQPADSDRNNVYNITIVASYKGISVEQPVAITVTDDLSDNGPSLTSADHKEILENKKLDFTITTETQEGRKVHYMINGGEDRLRFTIDPQSGKLSFNHFIPDFERPSDVNKDNLYKIVLRVTDDQNHSTLQNFTLTVTDEDGDAVAPVDILKTGQDDGPVKGLPFGRERDFTVIEQDGDRAIDTGKRMWEDSLHIKETLTYYEANDYCNGLNYAGYGDWRAPNRHELLEIIDHGKSKGDIMIDDIFDNKAGGYFWTSQKRLGGGPDKAWSISFNDSEPYDEPSGQKFHVRCVRGEEIRDHHNFSSEGDYILDHQTGLMWQYQPFREYNWEEAKAHCRNLKLAGYEDWRLPNVNEMLSIMPVEGMEILFEDMSPIQGGDMDSGHAWSSTELDENHAFYNLNFWDQESDHDSLIIMYDYRTKENNNETMLNRCVRGGHL